MITTYTPNTLGDVLVAVLQPSGEQQAVEQHDRVVRIYNPETNETTGYNFFNLTDDLNFPDNTNGQVYLNVDQVAVLNQKLQSAGFVDVLQPNPSQLVIGFVEEMTQHPDSDHLHVTKTRVSQTEVLQIVSGSPNMAENIKVVVAKPGTMMPNGSLIYDGQLRGVPSAGMIVSGRELKLAGAPDRPGALILPDEFGAVGDAFDFDLANASQLFD